MGDRVHHLQRKPQFCLAGELILSVGRVKTTNFLKALTILESVLMLSWSGKLIHSPAHCWIQLSAHPTRNPKQTYSCLVRFNSPTYSGTWLEITACGFPLLQSKPVASCGLGILCTVLLNSDSKTAAVLGPTLLLCQCREKLIYIPYTAEYSI